MAKITYANKVALNENPEIALINKVTDDDLNEIKSVVNTNDDNVGNLINLTTTTKTNIVAAVNELDSDKASSTDLGNVANLTTTDKTSAVAAINEINAAVGLTVHNSYSQSTTEPYSANYINTYIDDTGWVDMSSYVNTTNFTARNGQPPMARRIGKVVYWKGSVYCSTVVNNREATILSGIPSQFRPTGEFGRCGITWYISTPYHIFVDNTGSVRVSESSNIEVQNDWAGFTLANISGYLVD